MSTQSAILVVSNNKAEAERAARWERMLADVAAERWGSLELRSSLDRSKKRDPASESFNNPPNFGKRKESSS